MQCEEARSRFVDFLEEDQLVRDHLQQCVECRKEFEQLQNFWLELGDSPVPVREATETRAAVMESMAELKRRSNMKTVLKVAAGIVLFVGIAVGAGRFLKPGSATDSLSHIRGAAAAQVELVEYGDYECPPCYAHQYHLMIDRMLEKYPGMVRYEFRHFPLTTIHPNALPAAMAAEAAGAQGKFWEMHKLLLSTHEKWAKNPQARDVFVDLAKQLGLNREKFLKSLDSRELEQTILKEAATARAAGISATPTFVLNGKKLDPTPTTFEEFETQIRRYLLK